MTIVDYTTHFWGDKHIGYHVLYENLKKGEDSIQELSNFVKERMGIEDDLLKFLHKSINRVNNYVTSNGAFADSWRLTKGTLELWAEIQTSLLKNLSDLSKDVIKYHDDLVKSRKRAKEYDVLDAVNLMQTTTTCLQKAKETYNQRCTEVTNMKNDMTTTKEFLRAKNKLTKAHEEYKLYVEKYNQVRDNFEEKMLKAAGIFQSHDEAHLQQMKNFFTVYARSLDDSHFSVAQMLSDYRRSIENVDIVGIMQRFVLEKGTGIEKPGPIIWTEADEIPAELEAFAAGLASSHSAGGGLGGANGGNSSQPSAPSSSNSSAVVAANPPPDPTVNDLLGINDSWTTVIGAPRASDSKSCDSDSDGGGINGPSANSTSNASHSYVPQFSSWLGRQKLTQWRKKHSASQSNLPAATTAASDTLADFSSSYNNDSGISAMNSGISAGTASSAPSSKGNFLLRRYRKSINDLTSMNEGKDCLPTADDSQGSGGSLKSDEKTPTNFDTNSSAPSSTIHFGALSLLFSTPFENGWDTPVLSNVNATDSQQNSAALPPPIPNSEPPPLFGVTMGTVPRVSDRRISASSSSKGIVDSLGGQIFGASDGMFSTGDPEPSEAVSKSATTKNRRKTKDPWATTNAESACSSSSSSDDDDAEFQTSKIRTLQIKPVNDSNPKINTSVDELRNVIGHLTLQRSSTFDKDPWSAASDTWKGSFSHSLNTSVKPMRATLTGDEHLRRKFSEFDTMLPSSNFDFSQSAGGGGGATLPSFGAGSGIARARPRSHTPTAAQLMQIQSSNSSTSMQQDKIASPLNASINSGSGSSQSGAPALASTLLTMGGGNFGSLSNVSDSNASFFGANGGGTTSTSPLNFPTPIATKSDDASQTVRQQIQQQRLPIAMALNEYIHVWFKKAASEETVVRIFGTVMISIPTSILPYLVDKSREIGPLKFCLRNATQIKSILPNQKLIEAISRLEPPMNSYSFKIDRDILAIWLSTQQRVKPASTFHNVDIVRYELADNVSEVGLEKATAFTPPLQFTSYWRTEPNQIDLRVDYRLNTSSGLAAQHPLLNILFTTAINSAKVESLNSDPDAKWNTEAGTLNWTLTELSKHGECDGSLKARLKLVAGSVAPTPANTSVQFQISDASASNIAVSLENEDDFALSMVRRKIIAGKYFCEAQIR